MNLRPFSSIEDITLTKSSWNIVHAKKNVLQIKRIKMMGLYSSMVSLNQLASNVIVMDVLPIVILVK